MGTAVNVDCIQHGWKKQSHVDWKCKTDVLILYLFCCYSVYMYSEGEYHSKPRYSVSDYTEGQHVCVKGNNVCQSFSVKKPWALRKEQLGWEETCFNRNY